MEQDIAWHCSSQDRSVVLERLAIAAVEAQQRLDIVAEDGMAVSHEAGSSWVWLDLEGTQHVSIPNPDRIMLCEEEIDRVRGSTYRIYSACLKVRLDRRGSAGSDWTRCRFRRCGNSGGDLLATSPRCLRSLIHGVFHVYRLPDA